MKIVIIAFLALVLAIPGALGAEKVFRGASGAAWEEDGNWSDGMEPTAADDARIPAGVIVTVVSTATAKLGIDVTSGVNRIGVTGETYGEVLGDGTAYLIQRPIGFTVLLR